MTTSNEELRTKPQKRRNLFRDEPVPRHIKAKRRKALLAMTMLAATLSAIGYIVYTFIYVVGIADIKSGVTKSERALAAQVSVAWALFIVVVVIPATLFLQRTLSYYFEKRPPQ